MNKKNPFIALGTIVTTMLCLTLFTGCNNKFSPFEMEKEGDMEFIVEVAASDLLYQLSGQKTDTTFLAVLTQAEHGYAESRANFIDVFAHHWKEATGQPLATIFATQQMRESVTPQSTDAQVGEALKTALDEAYATTDAVLRVRLDNADMERCNIEPLPDRHAFLIRVRGVKDEVAFRRMIAAQGKLEFWETYDLDELRPSLVQVDAACAQTMAMESQALLELEAASNTGDALDAAIAEMEREQQAAEQQQYAEHPLLARLHILSTGSSLAIVGYAAPADMTTVEKIFHSEEARRILPPDLKLMWSSAPTTMGDDQEYYDLYAIKTSGSNGEAPLDGSCIVDADASDGGFGPVVNLKMNIEGGRTWASLTRFNIGRAIAMTLDGRVLSAPRVNCEITGGASQISGNFTMEECEDMANIFTAGQLPAALRIISEEHYQAPLTNR